ncbi:MAG: hypothetical protein Kow0074_10600 [Candidatus Zixiibacteriota bacterium]
MKTVNNPNSIRQRLTALILGAILLVAGACGGNDSGQTDSGRTVVRFWQFWTDPKVKEVITKAVEEFETENPEYTVEVTDLTWNDGHQKIVAAFAGNEAPDLLELGSDWIAEFADPGALTDLSSEYRRLQADYIGWPPAIYRGSCWALPWYLSTRVLYQNDVIAEVVGLRPNRPPVTWGELKLWSRFANRHKPQFYGYGINAAEQHRLYKAFLPYLWSNEGDILDYDSTTGQHCALVMPEAIEALQFLVDMKQFGIVEKQAVLDNMFMSGKLLYHLSGDWLYRRIEEADIPDFRYSVHMIPQPNIDHGSPTSFSGGEYLAIPRAAREPLGAIKLARHLLRPKHIFNLCIATGCATPVHIETGNNPYFYDNEVRRVFMQQMLNSQSPPVHPDWIEIEKALEWGIEQALYGKMDPPSALAETCDRINKILEQ